ncbi:hypothetical protein HanXRQr2_Chr04g0183721 [Helianthus annuus]|uniref:Uncharacterized protein n=1 Tax=Helianthus annuus TaxID=4232 RepID=A0A9K3NT52_HELAN|nr:hypothetical protein HanXRQr2_Chr04g0183721 [Helianthus annuus]KAJ0582269.1 hypothetical protein HanHA300_Chr04g0150361 [Helianthus annuus]KAJ0590467.1 hypothetical protein HanIR_Chr04g0197741 [Helianthus annuus]KAJ0598247.1 hypothetical protein HanHA89_Chr04g0163681 [Helianthus annuus]KAJ0762524.1 hypothetical protein HanOQP8_Chr04g0162311 [Helianthus annuus]
MLICLLNLPLVLVSELSNLGIGPEKRKCAPTASAAPKKNETVKVQTSKAKNAGVEKKGMRHSSDSWCDCVVVSVSLEGLAPAVVRRPKPEPKDTADIPPSNPHDPIDLESSPERLVRKKAGKRKQTDAEAEGQPAKKVQRKKITRRGNLDAFISELVPGLLVVRILRLKNLLMLPWMRKKLLAQRLWLMRVTRKLLTLLLMIWRKGKLLKRSLL